ncbi:hypothetical protein I7I51_04926 [Histoplasma capsulatum]|uniref:Uncharacterized protein n=1 Tax=Ajellomyces capsulatus TaxID=5037 RepID=A0A8A1M233_AJECA|nr:hypothetical protein I7I51_04926 [Histoplasma capsulatum]
MGPEPPDKRIPMSKYDTLRLPSSDDGRSLLLHWGPRIYMLPLSSSPAPKKAHMSDAPAGSLSHPHISLKTAKARSKSLFNLILMIARIGSLLSYGRQLIGLFWHFSPEHAMKVHCLWIAILSSMLRTIVLDQLPSVDLRRSPYSANKTEHAGWKELICRFLNFTMAYIPPRNYLLTPPAIEHGGFQRLQPEKVPDVVGDWRQ